MSTTYTVMTCNKANRLGLGPTLRKYGYTIRIEPAEQWTSEGIDVEGLGWCPHPPRKHMRHLYGWYKHKSFAEERAKDLNEMERA